MITDITRLLNQDERDLLPHVRMQKQYWPAFVGSNASHLAIYSNVFATKVLIRNAHVKKMRKPFIPQHNAQLIAFAKAYSSAVASADLDILVGDQCYDVLYSRCLLGSWAGQVNGKRTSKPRFFTREHSRLMDIRGSIAHYETIEEWLSMLERLSLLQARVLVVSGFAFSIQQQLPKMHLIHPHRNLSGLSIRVLGAPLLPGFSTPLWEMPEDLANDTFVDNMERMKASGEWHPAVNQVALLGCGGYALPLAHHAKSRNISSVTLGGLLPVLFGIYGKRHLGQGALFAPGHNQTIKHLINSHWKRPHAKETPDAEYARIYSFNGETLSYW